MEIPGDYVQLDLDIEGDKGASGYATHVRRGTTYKEWYDANAEWIGVTVLGLMHDKTKFAPKNIDIYLHVEECSGDRDNWEEREILPEFRFMNQNRFNIRHVEPG